MQQSIPVLLTIWVITVLEEQGLGALPSVFLASPAPDNLNSLGRADRVSTIYHWMFL